jgi:hypothetical protein
VWHSSAGISSTRFVQHAFRTRVSYTRFVHASFTNRDVCGADRQVAPPTNRWDRLRADLDLVLDQWGTDMADVPGGASGLLVRDYKGPETHRLVTRLNPG